MRTDQWGRNVDFLKDAAASDVYKRHLSWKLMVIDTDKDDDRTLACLSSWGFTSTESTCIFSLSMYLWSLTSYWQGLLFLAYRVPLSLIAPCAQLQSSTTRFLWMLSGTARSKSFTEYKNLSLIYTLFQVMTFIELKTRSIDYWRPEHWQALFHQYVGPAATHFLNSCHTASNHVMRKESNLSYCNQCYDDCGRVQAVIYDAFDAINDFLGSSVRCMVSWAPEHTTGWDPHWVLRKVRFCHCPYNHLDTCMKPF